MVSHHNHGTIKPMEGLRGFAAFMVFVVHFAAQSQSWVSEDSFTFDLIFYLRFLGATGVDLFFILSGFLIYGMLIKRSVNYKTYAKRRIKRIYPTFLVVMGLYLVLSVLFPQESKLPEGLLNIGVYLVQCLLLLPGLFDIRPLFAVAWTLSYEMFFYLLVPIVIATIRLRQWRWQQRMLFLTASTVTGFFIAWFNASHIEMLMFISGMMIFELRQKQISFTKLSASWLLPATLFSMLLIRYFFYFDYTWFVVVVMYFGYGLSCLSIFEGRPAIAKIFAHRYMRWYGNMSYSYYLIHGLTLKFLFLVLSLLLAPSASQDWVFYTMFIPFFLLTLIVSAFLFVLIEKPLSLQKK